jgi:ferric-dicitrate binding protein FerR (iron transport regulator)
MTDEQIIKYIKGELNESERAEVVSWIESKECNFRHFSKLQLAETFREMEHEVLSEEEAKERLAAAGWPGKADLKRKSGWLSLITRIAAILLIPLTVVGVWTISRKNGQIKYLTESANIERIAPIQDAASSTYIVNPGVKGDIILPDGSHVRLNSASTLKCPDRFDAQARVVELSGEGFFDVEGNPDWPMYVKTSKGLTVKVTGTRFNVSSYENDPALKLTLVEGSLTVIHEATERQYTVRPNEEMVFYDGMQTRPQKQEVDVLPAIIWKDGVLLFENTDMPEVIKKLERWYCVYIIPQDPAIMEMRFTASFESESLTQVLQLLKITSKIDYRIDGKKVFLTRR